MTKRLATDSEGTSHAATRMSAEERREQIVRVAVSLFSRRGFRGTTTKEIAQAAGVSEAIIFRHFATKEELYAAILDHKACAGSMIDPRGLLCEALQERDDRAVFEGIAREALNHHAEDTEFLRLVMYSALEGHELARMFWERNIKQSYEVFGAYIRERQREGAFRQLEPLVIVRAFIGMLIHHSLSNTLWDPSRSLLDISDEAAAREFTEIILRGIVKPKAKTAVARKAPARRAKGPAKETIKDTVKNLAKDSKDTKKK